MINQILRDAVSGWRLTERLLRLTLPLLQYQEEDFKTMSFSMISEHRKPLGFISWHDVQSSPDALTLHGLYINTLAQARGLGKQLLRYSERHARSVGVTKLELKAWRDAEPYFQHLGFSEKNKMRQENEYPVLLYREIHRV
ncbi:MAG: GNAT family N-acetyltransferase [Granulosicoccus sp.]|nr:GNAT family N-acetyltransferase [Granulosicoccus sp.]